MVPALVDSELMQRAVRGEREAIALLYDANAPDLVGLACRILGDKEAAEDVVHGAFATLPDRGRYYSMTRGSVRAWLLLLVRNLCIDRLRREGRLAITARHGSVEGARAEATGDPDASGVMSSTHRRVRSALASLAETERAMLEAAFFEGFTYAQIAERDGESLTTVRARCAGAIAALCEALAAPDNLGNDRRR